MADIRVMLVDDEPLALENVYQLVPWEEHGFSVVAKAFNGKMALRLFEQTQPQIVITDISMPQMDGLMLGEQIHRLNLKTELLFLTAYRDFEYARQAIELQAASYLLKHEISHNRLLNQLLKIKSKIESETSFWNGARQQLLTDLLLGKRKALSNESASSTTQYLLESIKGSLGLVYFEWEPVITVNGDKTSEKIIGIEEVWSRIKAALSEADDKMEWIDAVSIEEGGYVILLKLPGPNSTLLAHYVMQRVSLIILQQIRQDHLSFSGPKLMMAVCEGKEKLAEAYAAIQKFYEYSLFLPPKAVFSLDQAMTQLPRNLSGFIDNLRHEENVPGLVCLEDERIRGDEQDKLHGLSDWVKAAGSRLIEDGFVSADYPLGSDAVQIGEEIRRLWSVWLEEQAVDRNCYSRWVSLAMAYVKSKYEDSDLSLETVAEHLGISAVHLRTTFKKETGRSLLEYTTEYRVSMAKKMLRNSQCKIYEVSDQVGYKTSQYFSQIFKKATGMHPKDYQQQWEARK